MQSVAARVAPRGVVRMASSRVMAKANTAPNVVVPKSVRLTASLSPFCQRPTTLYSKRAFTKRRTLALVRPGELQVTASKEETCYVTTPIYYVNDKPHIGHVYTSTLADVYARYQRAIGRDTFFLTGTDEHGIKVEQSAERLGVPPQQLADENSAAFREAMQTFGLSFDDFIRTTDTRHKDQVAAFVTQLLGKDMVYLGEFEGWYDEGQEEYVTEKNAQDQDYKSAISGKPLVRATEENYYFRLSAFQEKLEALYESNPTFVRPAARKNEILNRIKEGLQDVPVSRTNFTWGIPMPQDEKHVIYVWIDALFNYLSAINMGVAGGDARNKYWPAGVHVMAKEIAWFHAVIWPAVLMALDLPLPKMIYAHGFWVRDGVKMSKSLGNFVDLECLAGYVETYGLDGMRYYLLVQGPIGAIDANFSEQRLNELYTNDLVNTLGNCASRTTAMINKYYKGAGVPSEMGPDGERVTFEGYDFPALAAAATAEVLQSLEDFNLPAAATAAIKLVQQVDVFITATEPYKLAKDETQAVQLAAILYQCIEAVRIAGVLLEPIMPTKMDELAAALGTSDVEGTLEERAAWGQMVPGCNVQKVALFPRVEAPVAVGAS